MARWFTDAARQALPEPAQLAERLLPGASERHELGTVHVADARVGDHVGLLLAPARQRGRPLAGAAQLVRVLADADRVAVDETRCDRRELSCRHGHHRLVHQPPALVHATQAQHRAALIHPRERDEVEVAAVLPDRGRLAGGGVRGLVVAGRNLLDADRGENVAALGAVPALAVHQPLRAGKPARRGGRLPAQEQGEADPESAARGRQRVVGVQVGAVGALQCGHVFVVEAEHVGRAGQELEILRAEGVARSASESDSWASTHACFA